MAAGAQRQEAERPHDGDDHQGQENVPPAVVCEGTPTLPTISKNSVVIATATHWSDSTWYLRPSVPLEIDVKISKQHAGKEIKGSFSRGKDAFETDNGLIGRLLVTAAWKKTASTGLNPTEEQEGVGEITAAVY